MKKSLKIYSYKKEKYLLIIMNVVINKSDETANPNIFSKDPYVATYNNVLTDEECQHFIEISKGSLDR